MTEPEHVKVIEIRKSVFEDNDKDAAKLRKELKGRGVYLLNLMSSPGSGKTTTLIKTTFISHPHFVRIRVQFADAAQTNVEPYVSVLKTIRELDADPRVVTASGKAASPSSTRVTFLHSTHRSGSPSPVISPSMRLSPHAASRLRRE